MHIGLNLARVGRSFLIGGVAVLTLGLTAASSQALSLTTPTTTTLSASPTAISGTQTASLSATVSPYLLLLPQSVTFTDSTNGKTIATDNASLTCLVSLKPCTFAASVAASALAAGQNTIVAKYSGDLLEATSQATAYLYKGTPTTCSEPNSGCYASAQSADGTAEGSIYTESPSSGTETITIGFGTAPLPCTTPGTGDTMAFTVTNSGGAKSIRYEVFGAAAEKAEAAHPEGHVCYESTKSFTTASGAAAAKGSNGMYYGVLPTCIGGDDEGPATNPPCLEFTNYYENEGSGYVFVDFIEVPQSDPRISN
jgi:hypothetical protein